MPTRRTILVLLTIATVVAAGAIAWTTRLRERSFYTDAERIRTATTFVTPREVLWEPPIRQDALSSVDEDYEPSVSADGLTLVFVRGKAGHNADIWQSTRTSAGWSTPVPFAAVNSPADDLGPVFSHDGSSLFFYSNRVGGLGGYDLWVTERDGDTWTTPVNLGVEVNSPYNDYGPAPTPDHTLLYFASNRPRGAESPPDLDAWPATVREDLYQRDYDLYAAPITARGLGTASCLTTLSSPANDAAPTVSPHGDFVYFASDRSGGYGGFDLYRARRIGGEHRPPTNLGPPVNTPANELDPTLDLEGFGIHFSSDRRGERDAARSDYDLYHAVSREVFVDTESYRAAIDWATILPWLLWLLLTLLALLLLWLLRRFLRSASYRRLSLLAKCVLISAIAHLLIMMLFAFWTVSTDLADWMRPGSSRRVALTSPSTGSAIDAQLRGDVTEVAVDAALAEVESPPVVTEVSPAPELMMTAATSVPIPEPTPVTPEPTLVPMPLLEMAMLPPAQSMPTIASPADAPRIAAAESRVDPEAHTPDLADPAPMAAVDSTDAEIALDAPAVDIRTEARPSDPGPAPALVTQAEARPVVPTPDASEIRVTLPPITTPPVPTTEESVAVQPMVTPLDSEASPITPDALDRSNAPMVVTPPAATVVPAPAPPAVDAPMPTRVVDADLRPTTPVEPARVAAPVVVSSVMPAAAPARGTDAETAPEFSTELTAVASTPRLADDPTLIAEAPSSFDIVPLHVGAAPAIPIAALPMPEAAAMPVDTQPLLPRMPEVAIDIDLPTDTLARSAASETADATVPRPMLEVATMAPVMVDTAPPDAAAVSMAAAPLSMPAPAPGHADVQAPPVPGMADARPSTAEVGLPSAPPTAVSIETFPTVDAVASEEAAVTIAASRMDDTETPATMVPMPASSPTTVQAARVKVAAPASTSPVPRPSDLAYEAAVALRVDIPDRTRIEPPATVLPDEDPYRMRRAAERDALVEEMGGSRETEAAVAAALAWLAKQQQPDGHWDSFEHRSDCPDCEATADVDIALTGLSLLCFLAADHTHVKDGPYREVVQRGIDWLLGRQRRDGSFLGRESMYSHGIASIAMAEAYGMTGDVRLRAPTETATRFILDARHPEHGGWRYAPRQDGDTSVLGWQIMALRSARQAGVPIPDDVDTTTRRWLDTVSRPSRPGRYAYRPGEPPTPTMTAEAMFVRQLLGDPRDASGMDAATEHILGAMPNWERDSNSYYWYYATLALYQHQGDAWAQWNAAMKDTLLGHQVQRGPNAGSFPPAGQWARVGGRIYQTAICTLTLEVYYRYLPRYMVAAPDAADPTADE